jgi:NAD+ diphosphatase
MEVGETVEAATQREVSEETNVQINPATLQLITLQPWPFPQSLMIGCLARASTTGIKIDEVCSLVRLR